MIDQDARGNTICTICSTVGSFRVCRMAITAGLPSFYDEDTTDRQENNRFDAERVRLHTSPQRAPRNDRFIATSHREPLSKT